MTERPAGSPAVSTGERQPERRPGVVGWTLTSLLTLVAGLAALVAFFYLPWYLGSIPLPVSIVLIAFGCWALPRAAYVVTGSLLAAALPVLAAFALTAVLLLLPSGLYSAPLRVYQNGWRNYLLLGAVALAGAVSLSLLWAESLSASMRRPDAESDLDTGDTGQRDEQADRG
ncbi:hypothetical protein [Nakamurella aerolata]|uniref:Uncharacterized protein n=1 Tax=Nakamurella aerolata TaxID=1656892 RepID=A0A849ADR6_9ACTN|nr:hypothetical protein [Nakamurella aerolata]NNG37328.1 hypothetical protein [Nakamurella aerolata]